jgi:hypothetical protein
METILEQQRRYHEERERLMDAMVKEMMHKKPTVSLRFRFIYDSIITSKRPFLLSYTASSAYVHYPMYIDTLMNTSTISASRNY